MMNMYKKLIVNDIEMISFSKDFLEEDSVLKSLMPMSVFVELLQSNGYSVKLKENGKTYCKFLNGDVSTIEYETELDAYIDCYIHACETNRI